MDDNKKEATKHLVESIKLTFTISSVFGAGIVAYSSKVATTGRCFWIALGLYFLALILSIYCINTLVNKTWKNAENLIYEKAVVVPWWGMMISVVLAFGFTCAFIIVSEKKVDDTELYLKTENIDLKYNQSYDVEYRKDSTGQIQLNVKQLNGQ